MVELGVVQPVQQVDRARPRGRQTDPEPPGRLGITGRHEGGGLFVMHQDEAHLVRMTAQPFHDPVDAVAGKAEDRVNSPFG